MPPLSNSIRKRSLKSILLLAFLAILSTPAVIVAFQRQDDNYASPGVNRQMVLRDCLVQATQEIEVPAKEQGALTEVFFKEGDFVEEGQPIASIDDERVRMELFAAKTRSAASMKEANNEIGILEAEAALRVAISDRDRNFRLLEKKAITEADYEHSQLAVEHAELALKNRQYEKEIAVLKARVDEEAVKAAEKMVARHQVTAPYTGNIFRLNKHRGEWVNSGDSMLLLARLDLLTVNATIDGRQCNPEEILGSPCKSLPKELVEKSSSSKGKSSSLAHGNLQIKLTKCELR